MFEEDLQVSFVLKIGETFVSEHELAARLEQLLGNSERRKLETTIPDGAVSIRYWQEELLGIEYWDYVRDTVATLAGSLPMLMRGQTASVRVELQGLTVTLKPGGDRVVFDVLQQAPGVQRHSKHALPLAQFVRDVEFMSWRLERTIATFRGGPNGTRLATWRGQVDEALRDIVRPEQIAWILEQPLETVLLQSQPPQPGA